MNFDAALQVALAGYRISAPHWRRGEYWTTHRTEDGYFLRRHSGLSYGPWGTAGKRRHRECTDWVIVMYEATPQQFEDAVGD